MGAFFKAQPRRGDINASWSRCRYVILIKLHHISREGHKVPITTSYNTVATTIDVEFKTYDGLTLKGTLFPAGDKRPCVIMTASVSYAGIPSSHPLLLVSLTHATPIHSQKSTFPSRICWALPGGGYHGPSVRQPVLNKSILKPFEEKKECRVLIRMHIKLLLTLYVSLGLRKS
jgi:hypothetical protein